MPPSKPRIEESADTKDAAPVEATDAAEASREARIRAAIEHVRKRQAGILKKLAD